MTGEEGLHRAIFILRLDRGARGRVTGVVERVRTGEKTRVETLAEVGDVLAAMLASEASAPEDRRHPPRRQRARGRSSRR